MMLAQYLFLVFWMLGTTHCNALVCKTEKLYRTVEVYCNDIPSRSEFKNLSNVTTHLFLQCGLMTPLSQSESRLNELGSLSEQLPLLNLFSLQRCPILVLPGTLLHDLPRLQKLHLTGLSRLAILGGLNDTLRGSSALLHFTLNDVPALRFLPPGLLMSQRLQRLHLVRTSMTPTVVASMLPALYSSLDELVWRASLVPLAPLPPKFLRLFVFSSLDFGDSGLRDPGFLAVSRALSISLRANPGLGPRLQLPTYSGFRATVRSFNLEATSLSGTFPSCDDCPMPLLAELLLSQNYITALHTELSILCPNLTILDVRQNRLRTFPPSLQLLVPLTRLLAADNTIHCNCQLQPLLTRSPKLYSGLRCATRATLATGPATAASTGSIRINEGTLVCVLPSVDLQTTSQFLHYGLRMVPAASVVAVNSSINDNSSTITIYELELYENEVVNLRCYGYGDPAPKLEWRQGSTGKVERQSRSFVQLNTTDISNIIVEPARTWGRPAGGNFTEWRSFECSAVSRQIEARAILRLGVAWGRSRGPPVRLGRLSGPGGGTNGRAGWIGFLVHAPMMTVLGRLIKMC